MILTLLVFNKLKKKIETQHRMGRGDFIEISPWIKWTIGLAVVLLLALIGMTIAILVIVADDNHHHHHHKHSSSSDDDDDHKIDTVCTKDFIDGLKDSKWFGNATILRAKDVLIGVEHLEFLKEPPRSHYYGHSPKLPKTAFYAVNHFKSFDPKTWKLIAEGSEIFSGFIEVFPDGGCVLQGTELEPEPSTFLRIRFFDRERLQFSLFESIGENPSFSLSGLLARVH